MRRHREGAAEDGPPRIALFTVTLDRLDYTRRTLDTLEGSTLLPYDHFVIDNGSTDGTVAFLRSAEERFAGVVFNCENLGLDQATNQALELIGGDYDFIVKVDNDCEFVDRGWLEALVDVCEAFDRRIAVSPRAEGTGPGEYDGGHPRSRWVRRAGRVVGLTDHAGGLCLLAPAWMYDGFRYRNNPLHGNQDVLFSLHVRLDLKCLMGYVEDVSVRHMDRTDGQLQRFPEYFASRREQQQQVFGEPPVLTAVLGPPRRAWLLWRMGRGNLLQGGLGGYLLGRLRARAARVWPRLSEPRGDLVSVDGTGHPPVPGPRKPPEWLMREHAGDDLPAQRWRP
jgi:glycosyltransferase involved in cell wall biosynthesis